jgi:hypothetical protein
MKPSSDIDMWALTLAMGTPFPWVVMVDFASTLGLPGPEGVTRR